MRVQVDEVRFDVGNITEAANAAIPDDENLDLSALVDARRELDSVYEDAVGIQDDVKTYLDIVEIIIYILGACAFAVGAIGLITLALRVRPLLVV